MSVGQLLTISCFLTGIVMVVFVGGILFTMRYGQQMVTNIVNRFLDPSKRNADTKEGDSTGRQTTQPQVASSQSLRQRAQSLDFPAPSGTAAFGAQAAQGDYGQTGYQQAPQASLRPRDQYPEFNPQAAAPSQTQGFQPSMPSLSASRPYDAGSVQAPQPPSYGQQGNYPQQPQAPQQFGQQGGFPQQAPQQFGQQGNYSQQATQPVRSQGNYPQQPQAPQQFGQQPPPPLRPQGNYPQQPQAPQQFGQQPPPPLRPQGNYPQQPQAPNPLGQPQRPHSFPQQPPPLGQFGQQSAAPQQGGLDNSYRPPLKSRPNVDNTQASQRRLRRDNRSLDDFDEGGLIDGAGDILDSF